MKTRGILVPDQQNGSAELGVIAHTPSEPSVDRVRRERAPAAVEVLLVPTPPHAVACSTSHRFKGLGVVQRNVSVIDKRKPGNTVVG
jgi:hypothetical protein